MTPRIEPFFTSDSKNWTFVLTWLTELNFLLHMTQRIEPFWKYESKELNFFEYDSKNWTSFLAYDSIFRTFFMNMTQRCCSLFSKYDSKNELFSFMTRRLALFFFLEMWPSRIESFENLTQRMWTFFLQYDSKKWIFGRCFLFFEYDTQIWTFLNTTHRFEPFWIRHTVLNHFEYDTQIWTFLNTTHRFEPFFNMTHRIEPFLLNVTQRIAFFLMWLKELHFAHVTQRIEPSFELDSKDWTIFQNFERDTISRAGSPEC